MKDTANHDMRHEDEDNPPAPPFSPGQRVSNPARLDWGVGVVRSVQATRVAGGEALRVTVDFPVSGAKVLMVPPAQLTPPPEEVKRDTGWLESLSGRTTDDRLRKVPDELARVLGGPRERLAALLPLYRFGDDPRELDKWARVQTGCGDPLGLWSRDELAEAFAAFCRERDALLRVHAAAIAAKEGREALHELVQALETPVRERVREALGRAI